MTEVAVLISIFGTLLVCGLGLVLLAGSPSRLFAALGLCRKAAADAEFAKQLDALGSPPPPLPPPKPSGAPLRLLALMQRKGRLIDFLMEDISGYTVEQIGSSVRDIHRDCRKVLQDYVVLVPVLPQAEGEMADVPAGFDPSAIQLTGNVTGQPPFKGTVQHPGWRAKELKLAEPPTGQDEFVLMPAEVNLA